MGNLHVVAVTAVSVPSTAEVVIATMTAWNENEGPAGAHGPDLNQTGASGAGAQGVYLGGSINVTPTGTGVLTVRVRVGSLTGAIIGVAQGVNVTTAVAAALDIGELDPTTIQTPAIYVLTLQASGGTTSAVVNRAVFTAEEASAFA